MSQPKLSIIIPTRDRAETLVHSLKTALSQPNTDIEIVVSDNFSSPAVKQVVDKAGDARIRYVRTPKRIGMTEHYEFAVGHAKGDWLTILGDDDGLLPGAIDKFFALVAKHPDIKAITAVNCFYTWPAASVGAQPRFRLNRGKGYELRDSKACLKKTMLGEIAYLPTIYTGGFVHKDIIAEVKSKTAGGLFFNSIIPDVYSGKAITSVTEKYMYVWEPLAIAGVSKHGNGQQHKDKSRQDMKKLDFYSESTLKFLPSMGDACVESMQILLYECFLQSQHLRSDNFGVTLPQQLEIAILHASKRTRKAVIEYCRDVANINGIDFAPILKSADAKRLLHKYKRLFRRLSKKIPGMSKTVRQNIDARGMTNVHEASQQAGALLAA